LPTWSAVHDATDPHLEARNTRPRPTPESVPGHGEVPFSNTGTDANPNHQDVDMEPGVPLHTSVPPLANAASLQQIKAGDIQLDHTLKQTTALTKKTKKKRKSSKATKKDRRATQEGMKPPKGLKSFEEYKNWVAEHCKDWQLVQTLYNKQEKIASVLSEHTKNGKRLFEVLRRPTYIRNKHIEFYEKNTRYRPSMTFAINPAESPNTIRRWHIDKAKLWRLVAWEPSIELADQIDQDPQVQVLITAMRIKNNTTAIHVALPRNDINLSNMDQQGIWPLLESRCTHPLLQDPALGACIHIDPLNSVNPDCDLHPTGQ
jgi:hypothetical protein